MINRLIINRFTITKTKINFLWRYQWRRNYNQTSTDICISSEVTATLYHAFQIIAAILMSNLWLTNFCWNTENLSILKIAALWLLYTIFSNMSMALLPIRYYYPIRYCPLDIPKEWEAVCLGLLISYYPSLISIASVSL